MVVCVVAAEHPLALRGGRASGARLRMVAATRSHSVARRVPVATGSQAQVWAQAGAACAERTPLPQTQGHSTA